MTSLMERIGDEGALDEVIERFHLKLIADPLTGPFFRHVDMEKLRYKQHWFLTMVFCGKSEGVAYYMQESHSRLVHEMGLGPEHFQRTMEHLETSLAESGLATELISDIMALAWGLEDAILGRARVKL